MQPYQLDVGYRFAMDNPHLVAAVRESEEQRLLHEEEEQRRVAEARQRYEAVRVALDEAMGDILENAKRMVCASALIFESLSDRLIS